jgi:hypothetical protein
MAQHPAEKFIKATDTAFAIVRTCTICKHYDMVRKGRPGTMGRGWGMREGNKQRGRLIQHIKEMHPEAIFPSGKEVAENA